MTHLRASFVGLALILSAAPALADEKIGFVGADVRRIMASAASDAERGFTSPNARNATDASERSASIAPLLASTTCDTPTVTYWEKAAPWIRRNTLPPIVLADDDSLGAEDAFRPGNARVARTQEFREPARMMARDMRRRTERVEEAIKTSAQHVYLTPGDDIAARPKDRATDLRQRAEWTTFVSAMLPQLKSAHEAAPNNFANAFVFAVWTRATCDIVKANGEAALSTLQEIGYPAAATYGGQTEIAFAILVRARNDAPFAQEALNRGGAGVAEMARRILEPLAARGRTAP